jgi:hypothetical protein
VVQLTLDRIWADQYLLLVNNRSADRTLRWKCPHTKRFGVAPDISALAMSRSCDGKDETAKGTCSSLVKLLSSHGNSAWKSFFNRTEGIGNHEW